MKFCARCGRKGETREGLCGRCYLEIHPEIDVSKQIIIKVCENCNKAFHRNRWSRYPNFKEAVKSIVKESLKTKKEVQIKPIIKEDKVIGEVEIEEIGEKYLIPVKIEKVLCDNCRKESGTYFEGTLQLRNVNEKIIEYVMEELENKYKEGVFVKEIDEVKNGIDIKITSQKYLQALASKLKKKFMGTTKITRTLFTRDKQRSKHVYRVTVLYKGED